MRAFFLIGSYYPVCVDGTNFELHRSKERKELSVRTIAQAAIAACATVNVPCHDLERSLAVFLHHNGEHKLKFANAAGKVIYKTLRDTLLSGEPLTGLINTDINPPTKLLAI